MGCRGSAGWFKEGAPGILGGRARIGRSPEITGTRRGRCAARKVELTGGPGWQRGVGATRAWSLVVRGERVRALKPWARWQGARAGWVVGRAGFWAGAWEELGCGAKQAGVERARSRAGWAVRREG